MTSLLDREAQQQTTRRDAQSVTPRCSMEGCGKTIRARGWCAQHYGRWQRHGDPTVRLNLYVKGSEEERFWAKVDPCRTDGCMVWLGALNSNGYGTLVVSGAGIQAHHFLVGKPPEGLEWDHVKERGCTHRNCIWPEHLELVTHRENVLRGTSPSSLNAMKTVCSEGHSFTPENTYVRNGARPGGRECRVCIRARERRRIRR